jgi:hypothetical protein
VVLTPAPQKNGGFGAVSFDVAPAASFRLLFDKTLYHQLFTHLASTQTIT